MTRRILGFNCYLHDAAACLLEDGRLVAFCEEERFTRRKHTGEFPALAIEQCLREGRIGFDELTDAAFYFKPWRLLWGRGRSVLQQFPRSLVQLFSHRPRTWMQLARARQELERRFAQPGRPARHRFRFVEHHACHAAASFFSTPFDHAAILSLDGAGEWATTWLGVGEGTSIRRVRQIGLPHSLGLLYSAVTHYLGFKPWSGEGKVMGLAGWGSPRHVAAFRDIVSCTPDGGFRLNLDYFDFQVGGWTEWVSPKFIEVFGPRRVPESELTEHHMDIAASLQVVVEDVAVHVARHLRELTGEDRLCLGGGVSLNCVMNSRIQQEAGFREVAIYPAAHDAGTAVGAALYVYHHVQGHARELWPEAHVYGGPEYAAHEYRAALQRGALQYTEPDALCATVADLLAQGKIIGWMQGRMESGPRALGNRSILADPRSADVKDRVNRTIKRRETFRPFGPSVLADAATTYFEMASPSPHMLLVNPVRAEWRDKLSGITHGDGTARVQTVTREQNSLYYELISAFGERTGVPMVLNTSFNVRGEPMVASPEDAVHCFLGTDLDALVLGPYLTIR